MYVFISSTIQRHEFSYQLYDCLSATLEKVCSRFSLSISFSLFDIDTHAVTHNIHIYMHQCVLVCACAYTHVCIDISSITEQHYALLCSALLIVLIRVCVCINVHKWYRWSTLECTASDKRNQPHTLNETATITTTQSSVWSKHERFDRQRKQKSEQCKAYLNVRECKVYTTHWTKFKRPARQAGRQMGGQRNGRTQINYRGKAADNIWRKPMFGLW